MSLDLKPEASPPLTHVRELVETFYAAMKPAAAHRVGLEHELTGFAGLQPVGFAGPGGIERLLRAFERFGYQPFEETGRAIAMLGGSRQISLEPGGQVEHAGSPFFSAQEAAREQELFLARLRAVAAERGLRFTSLGYRPVGSPATAAWMPKERYGALKRYLARAGALGLDMMAMTATAQVSLDYASEADLASKIAAALSASPLVSALCANSPLVDGKPSGYASYRCRVWQDVDPARCGVTVLPGRFSLEAYVEWAIAAPMIFIRRGGDYLEMKGRTFKDFLRDGFEGHRATRVDWTDHLSTLFPDVRVKQVIELRSADAAGAATAAALAALWRGVLYDPAARDEVIALGADLSAEERNQLRAGVAREGLGAAVGSFQALRASTELVAIARRGLGRLPHPGDAQLLHPFEQTVDQGASPAAGLLQAFAQGGLDAVIRRAAI